MALQKLEALEFILGMDDNETQRYLISLLERDPALFESIHDHIEHQDFLEELRDELHNGHRMYPEL
tara:strand:+ start:511 stop:708 length:198 start_codon:yes stop_codon:yes gene_type:complete